MKKVIIPEANKKDLTEIPKHIKRRLKFIPVQNMDEVLQVALVRSPAGEDTKKSPSRIRTKPTRPLASLPS